MDKNYDPKLAEQKWYKIWEEAGYFKPEINPEGKPYTILLPPPNASGKMHTGNVLMIAIEDLLIRWKRMQGYASLWVPGTDHAGTETQITFERDLKKEGKSRFDFSRQELYDTIWDFVQNNKHNIEGQIRQMGASVDWDRYTFTLDDKVLKTVTNTFKKLAEDNLLYRGNYIVNYCPKCGTTYADVELKHEERKDPLYFVNYRFADSNDHITVATVRPETIWADTHLAVNPKDAKNNSLVGKKVLNPLTRKEMTIISDDFVDPEFGTGIVKLTPGVDKNDYEVSLRHPEVKVIEVVDLNGKLVGFYEGLSVFTAREKAVEDLKEAFEKIDNNYLHSIALCKAGHEIEPLVLPNWFIKMDDEKISLKKPAYEAVKNGDIKIYPKWREVTYLRWMEEMRDWPISRQNVWGIRIPVFYEINQETNIRVLFKYEDVLIGGDLRELLHPTGTAGDYRTFAGNTKKARILSLQNKQFNLNEIKQGLQRVIASSEAKWVIEGDQDDGKDYIPETDTFDTWFSSGQWPLVTLGYPDSEDFQKYYPTAVLETGWEIIRLWVSRMIMFGYYLAGDKPFADVYLHGMVRALDGRKMSKSLGNVINPEEYMEQYGVDALRIGLISGTANGKDFAFPKDRVIAYKHFANKIWNMARFSLMMAEQVQGDLPKFEDIDPSKLTEEDKTMIEGVKALVKEVNAALEKYRFADAAEAIYQFMWKEMADKYIESIKNREDKEIALPTFLYIYTICLKMLHPFMPYVTEDIYQYLPTKDTDSIMIAKWPEA